ncbi:hypothetical protein XENORESO_017878 [Xenotaenia resolanae]|uniref:Secreted protein n=1 Tax=Xenotaenia resolanae TaxID=208358 RepID=A0ABV0W0B4_9TELE
MSRIVGWLSKSMTLCLQYSVISHVSPSRAGIERPNPPAATTITYFVVSSHISLTSPTTHKHQLVSDATLNASFDCYLSHRSTLNASRVTRRYASSGVAQYRPCNSTLSSG